MLVPANLIVALSMFGTISIYLVAAGLQEMVYWMTNRSDEWDE